jgi:hypothetical protein
MEPVEQVATVLLGALQDDRPWCLGFRVVSRAGARNGRFLAGRTTTGRVVLVSVPATQHCDAVRAILQRRFEYLLAHSPECKNRQW